MVAVVGPGFVEQTLAGSESNRKAYGYVPRLVRAAARAPVRGRPARSEASRRSCRPRTSDTPSTTVRSILGLRRSARILRVPFLGDVDHFCRHTRAGQIELRTCRRISRRVRRATPPVLAACVEQKELTEIAPVVTMRKNR